MKTTLLFVPLCYLAFSCSEKKQDQAATAPAVSNTLMLTESQLQLANITTQKVTTKAIGQTLVINANLAVNELLSEVVSSRAAGRIEKLFVKETGRTVQKGEPLYELYSENLLTLEREYLLAREQFEQIGKEELRYESFVKAAEKKLLLYGLAKKQIDNLAQSKTAQPRITMLAPASGVVSEVSVTEGQYVIEGAMLYKIEDLRKIWLEAELYPHEAAYVRYGDQVRIQVAGFENSPTEGIVTFLNPAYKANTQIVLMRITLQNPELKFKPGMQAQVLFTHSAKNSLTLPADAVIKRGKGAHVYVQSDNLTFEPRQVTTGIEDAGRVEITEGLTEGEQVVVTGAYLLYSELVLRRGTDPMVAHTSHSHHN